MSRINLLPDQVIASQRRARTTRNVTVAGVVVLALAAGWGTLAYRQIRALSAQADAAQARLAAEQQRAARLQSSKAEYDTLRAVLAHRDQLRSPVPAPSVLTLLTHLLPESVVLTRLSLDVPPVDMVDRSKQADRSRQTAASKLTADSARLLLEGLATSDVELAQLVNTLTRHGAFVNVKLVRGRQVAVGELTRFGFEITMDVRPARAPEDVVSRAAGEEERGA